MSQPDTSLRPIPKGLIASRLESLGKAKENPDRLALTASLWRLREAAAVLVALDPSTLRPVGGSAGFDERARLDFMADLVPIERATGATRWCLSSGVRQSALQRMKQATPEETRRRLQQALAANPDRPDDDLQTMLEDAIAGRLPAADTLNRNKLTALATIAGWLAGIVDGLPSRDALTRALGFAEFLHPRTQLADEFFVGREDELQRLADHVGALPINLSEGAVAGLLSHARRLVQSIEGSLEGRRPFMFVYGPGGVGKSTLLARFIIAHAAQPDSALPFVVVDVDRPEIEPLRPLTLLVEAARQLVQQRFESLRSPLQELNEEILDGVDSQETGALESVVDDTSYFVTRFAGLIGPLLGETPLVFIVDTFEEVQYFGPEAELVVFEFLERLARALPSLRVIVVGRAKPERSGIYLVPVVDLPPEDGVRLLRSILEARGGAPRPAGELEEVVSQVGGNPMALRLAARLIAINDASGITQASSRGWLRRLRVEVLQARLYGRILGHLHDQDLSKLAFPGLVVRRIDVGVILGVLAVACRLSVASDEEARRLLGLFAKEVALVIAQPDGSLAYRADIRRVMLETLNETLSKEEIDQIDRLAVELWAKREGPMARGEEIYHRLRLTHDRSILDERWDPEAARYLRGALGEVPESSRVWLANKLGASLDDDARAGAVQVDWEQSVARTARRLLENGRPEEALRLLRERSERLEGSPLYGLEARALYALDQLDEAASVVAKGQHSLAESGDAPGSVDLVLLHALILERQGDLAPARELAGQAVVEARAAGVQMPLLRALLRLLRLMRKRDEPADGIRFLRDETAQLVRAIGIEHVGTDRALLNEIAAELGPVAPDILRAALDHVGIDVLSRAPKELLSQAFLRLGPMTPARVDSIIRGDPRELAKLAFSVFTAALARNPSDATQLLVEIFQDACDRVVNRSGQTARPGESRVRGKLTGPMLTKLATLVSEHFDQQELRTVLRLYLSRDAANILPPNSPPYHQALQLFLVAERDGWTSQLIDALSDYSKSDEFRVALDSDLKGWLSLRTST